MNCNELSHLKLINNQFIPANLINADINSNQNKPQYKYTLYTC